MIEDTAVATLFTTAGPVCFPGIKQPKMQQWPTVPPSGSYIRSVWDFFSTPLLLLHPLPRWQRMKRHTSRLTFRNKIPTSGAQFSCHYYESTLSQLPGYLNCHCGTLTAPPSPSLNAEFGAWKALSATDNGGSGCCGRTGRFNFSPFRVCAFTPSI